MLAPYIRKLLQVKFVGKKIAEPFGGLIVPVSGAVGFFVGTAADRVKLRSQVARRI